MKATTPNLRFAARVLSKDPGFAAVAVCTLALGIGANAAIFSLFNAILLRPLPYPNPEQLVGLGQWRNQKGEGYIQTGVSAPNIRDIEQSDVFQYVGYYRWSGFNITGGDRPESVNGIQASASLLPLFEIPPMMGRFLSPEEMKRGRDRVAVIGHRLWQMRYGSDPAILGKTINLDENPYTIVGVMPASFRFTWDQEMDVFVPLVLTPEERSETGRATSRDLQTQARLRDGISVAQAQAAMDALAATLAREHPAADQGWGIKVEPLHAAYHRHMEAPLWIMMGSVGFVLLIACVNVANLLLARATGRKREMAIRIAVGASRGQLIAQLLTESLLLAVTGGALGIALAYAGDRLLTVFMTRFHLNLPNVRAVDLDWRVLLFSLAVTLATGVLFGLAPSLAAVKTGLMESLREAGTAVTAEAGRRRLRNGLVVCETALALILITGAGLLVRTMIDLVNVDLGIDPANVITMGIHLPAYKYPGPIEQAAFFQSLMERIGHMPGVDAAGAQAGGASVFFQPQGQPQAAPGQEPTATFKITTPGFLKAIGTRIVEGREFTAQDTQGAQPVAIISETVARRYWPRTSPLGSHVTLLSRVYSGKDAGPARTLAIIGVAKDVRNEDLWRPEADIYVPFAQNPAPGVFLVARAAGPNLSLASPIRAAVLSIDAEQPVNNVQPMSKIIDETYGAIRLPMTLIWIFSGLALALSAIGLFGVMSYSVNRRKRELGIRIALGARREEVLRLVLREGLALTIVGIALGLIGAALLSRLMASYVYGITTTDPITFAIASLLLIFVGLLATYLPARGAARIDPITVLRCE